jgi:hypothetical protein
MTVVTVMTQGTSHTRRRELTLVDRPNMVDPEDFEQWAILHEAAR